MIQKLKRSLLILASLATLAAPALVSTASVSAEVNPPVNSTFGNDPDITSSVCGGTTVQLQTKDCAGLTDQTGDTFNSILTNVVNIFSIIVGIIAVIMIIVGGFKYITSGGESEGIRGAKNTIIYALVGLIIVALAQFIVHFVIGKVAGIGN